MNQTEETTQINNTINLLSTKTEYSRYIIFEPIPSMHPRRFSVAEDALQDTNDNTKATGGHIFLIQRIKACPITRPWQMLSPCDNSKFIF